MDLLLGGLLDKSLCHSRSYLPFFVTSPLVSSPYLLGFSGVLTQEGIVPHFMGRRVEGPEVCSWQKIKSNHKPSICSPRDPEDNEMFLIRN
jgi:hypothetical protein